MGSVFLDSTFIAAVGAIAFLVLVLLLFQPLSPAHAIDAGFGAVLLLGSDFEKKAVAFEALRDLVRAGFPEDEDETGYRKRFKAADCHEGIRKSPIVAKPNIRWHSQIMSRIVGILDFIRTRGANDVRT